MKVIYRPIKANGEYGEAKVLESIPDHVAYRRAHKAYPDSPEYVEHMLDGRGHINIYSETSVITYSQET